MEERIRQEIEDFLKKQGEGERFFDRPLVGFAAADDQLFADYKRVIGPFHRTPQEIFDAEAGGIVAATVIIWILPVIRQTRESNRTEKLYPSREWATTRFLGEKQNTALRQHLVGWLKQSGHSAVAPQLATCWQEYRETPVGIASTWSERHAAYAAGLGTFSLNDGLITTAGIAHRCGSVITDLRLAPSSRPYPHFRHNCLFYRNATCGVCIKRCPVGALSENGHDKLICREHVYETIPAAVSEEYGTPQTGCGLCQTAVPCESRIP